MPLPGSIIAISPWTDLTQSGESFIFNHDVDPSLCKETLDFYSKCYSRNPTDPLVSPLFGDVSGLPPSLIFAGKDEVLLDDSRRMHNKLVSSGCTSELVEAEGMWHAYVLYCIKERACDLDRINAFLNRFLSHERKLRWMRLDNAAKIYPAAKRRKWNNFFRLSATLCDEVDKTVLRNAMDVTMRRFRPLPFVFAEAHSGIILKNCPPHPKSRTKRAGRLHTRRLKASMNAHCVSSSTKTVLQLNSIMH